MDIWGAAEFSLMLGSSLHSSKDWNSGGGDLGPFYILTTGRHPICQKHPRCGSLPTFKLLFALFPFIWSPPTPTSINPFHLWKPNASLLPPKGLLQPTRPRQQSGNNKLTSTFPMAVRYIWGLQECFKSTHSGRLVSAGPPTVSTERRLVGEGQIGGSALLSHLPPPATGQSR